MIATLYGPGVSCERCDVSPACVFTLASPAVAALQLNKLHILTVIARQLNMYIFFKILRKSSVCKAISHEIVFFFFPFKKNYTSCICVTLVNHSKINVSYFHSHVICFQISLVQLLGEDHIVSPHFKSSCCSLTPALWSIVYSK